MINLDSKKNLILKDPNLYKSIIILALPIFLSNLLKSVHSFVDMYFVSPLGDDSIAAIVVTSPILSISQALAMGFMIAGAAIMSQALGAKNITKARKTSGQLLSLCLMCGVFFNVVLYLITPWVVKAIGAEGETLRLAIDYVRIRSFEMIPLFAFFAFLASRQASGDNVTPVIFDIFSIILNIVLTWYFVDVLKQGIRGAAIGTVIGVFSVMPIYMFMMFKDKKAEVVIEPKDLRFKLSEAKKIITLGIPSALSQAFQSLGFLIINSMILSYGTATVSGFGVGNTINNFVLMPALGVGGSIATFVGQNIGAENPQRAKQSVKTAMILSTIMMFVGGLILLPLRNYVGQIFLEPGTESWNVANQYMFFLFTSLPLMGILQVFMGAYQGAGYTRFSLILSTIRLWGLRIPLILLFRDIIKLDSVGIMYAMVISNYGADILGLILYKLVRFDRRIVTKESD
jgi:putative MATE family efflux protein